MHSENTESQPRQRRKDTTHFEKSNRGSQIIRLPFNEENYETLVADNVAYKEYVKGFVEQFPELFPEGMEKGFRLDDIRLSKRLNMPYRRIVFNKKKYTIQPSFVMPYWTSKTDDVWYPLLLLHYNVPYWLITMGFGRQDDFWYRLHLHLGRFNIVSTTAKRTGEVPKNLVADEKISYWHGKEVYICTTAAADCLWGAEPSLSEDSIGLTKGYGVFSDEAKALNTDYEPLSINMDGWKATKIAWQNLYKNVIFVLCFLHGYLKVRNTAKSQTQKDELFTQIWEAYHQEDKATFCLKLDELEQWAEKNITHTSTLNNIKKLCKRKEEYAVHYDNPQAQRTSNMVDRPMRRLDRFLFINQYFHGHFASAQLLTRAFALIYNFAPMCPRYFYKHPNKDKQLDSRAAQYNQFKYHENWLQNLLISASLNKIRITP